MAKILCSKNLSAIIEILSQRRVWSAILSGLVFVLGVLKLQLNIDIPVLTDLLTNLGAAIAGLIAAGLALWSYLQPKK